MIRGASDFLKSVERHNENLAFRALALTGYVEEWASTSKSSLRVTCFQLMLGTPEIVWVKI